MQKFSCCFIVGRFSLLNDDGEAVTAETGYFLLQRWLLEIPMDPMS